MPDDSETLASGGATSAAGLEWVVFTCAGHRFAFPLQRVREILPPHEYTRIPGCSPVVCGLAGVRGRVVTVFDFGVAAKLRPALEAPDHRVVLVEHGERLVGLAVDAIEAVARSTEELPLGADALRALDIERDDVLGVGALGDRPFLAVDPERVLGRLLT